MVDAVRPRRFLPGLERGGPQRRHVGESATACVTLGVEPNRNRRSYREDSRPMPKGKEATGVPVCSATASRWLANEPLLGVRVVPTWESL
jgi:hypothetical protein